MTILSMLITCLRILLGAILLFAGIAKLSNFGAFIINVDSYQMLPLGFVRPISYLLVSAEITLGVVLIVGYFSRGACILSSFIFLIFAVALANVILKKLPISDCGCGNFLFSLLDIIGFQITTVSWRTVLMDIILATVSYGIVISPHQGYGLELLMPKMRESNSVSHK